VGPLTALAYVLIIGTPTRFERGKQIGTYVGMIPCEESSAHNQRLGHISKQGNSLLRFLLVEAAQAAARIHPDWRRRYKRLAMRRHKSIAKVAMGRRMAIKLYWMSIHSKMRASSAGVSVVASCPACLLNSPASRSSRKRLLQRSINASLQSSLSRTAAQVWPASSSNIIRRRASSARPLRLAARWLSSIRSASVSTMVFSMNTTILPFQLLQSTSAIFISSRKKTLLRESIGGLSTQLPRVLKMQ